jgi:SAM-dependent methyltransferase
MINNHVEVLDYWNNDSVESMYDKHLLSAEIRLVTKYIKPNGSLLDAGCGEGETTLEYSKIPGIFVTAADFSSTRLSKADIRLNGASNVRIIKCDFLNPINLRNDCFDTIVSQRFIINLMEWRLQKQVLEFLASRVADGGRLILLEGHQFGVDRLNAIRSIFGLPPIPVKWHNLFIKEDELIAFMGDIGFSLAASAGLGAYFFLTRCVRPYFDSNLNWDAEFNRISSLDGVSDLLGASPDVSRLKLWVFERSSNNHLLFSANHSTQPAMSV